MGRLLTSCNHEVIYLEDAIEKGSEDLLVCAVAQANEAILVAVDGDMRQIARRHKVSKSRYRSLNLLKISCSEPQAANRVEQALSLIEHEWEFSEGKTGRRLFFEVSNSFLKTNR